MSVSIVARYVYLILYHVASNASRGHCHRRCAGCGHACHTGGDCCVGTSLLPQQKQIGWCSKWHHIAIHDSHGRQQPLLEGKQRPGKTHILANKSLRLCQPENQQQDKCSELQLVSWYIWHNQTMQSYTIEQSLVIWQCNTQLHTRDVHWWQTLQRQSPHRAIIYTAAVFSLQSPASV